MMELHFVGKKINSREVWEYDSNLYEYYPDKGIWLSYLEGEHLNNLSELYIELTEIRQEALAKSPKSVEIIGYVEELFYGEEFEQEVRFTEITEKEIIRKLTAFEELFVPREVKITITEVVE